MVYTADITLFYIHFHSVGLMPQSCCFISYPPHLINGVLAYCKSITPSENNLKFYLFSTYPHIVTVSFTSVLTAFTLLFFYAQCTRSIRAAYAQLTHSVRAVYAQCTRSYAILRKLCVI